MTPQEGLSFLPGNKFFSAVYFWLCGAFFAAHGRFVAVQGLGLLTVVGSLAAKHGLWALVVVALRLSCPTTCGIRSLTKDPTIFHVLAGGFLTTGPPEKSQ